MTKKTDDKPKVVNVNGKEAMSGITSGEILALLAQKHGGDVFIPECKDGETWAADGLLKLDAWVMKRSWSPLTTIGYEIKVSRQDFEQDEKWMRYADLTHKFYFVCPAGLIREEDLPKGIGLMWVSKARKLHTRRKAEATEPDTQKWNSLLVYALMSRSKIVANAREIYGDEPTCMEAMKAVVEEANKRGQLAKFITGHIRERCEAAQKTEQGIADREYHVRDFTQRLAAVGIVWNAEERNWEQTMHVHNEIDLLRNRVTQQVLFKMQHLGRLLGDTVTEIEGLRRRDPKAKVEEKKATT